MRICRHGRAMACEARRPGSRAIVREIRVTRGSGEADGLDVRDVEVDLVTEEAQCREAVDGAPSPASLGMAPRGCPADR